MLSTIPNQQIIAAPTSPNCFNWLPVYSNSSIVHEDAFSPFDIINIKLPTRIAQYFNSMNFFSTKNPYSINFKQEHENKEIKITYQNNFKGVNTGDLVAFKHPDPTFIQYGISKGQEIFADSNTKLDTAVTHSAIVVNATDTNVCIAEAIKSGLTSDCININNLSDILCFGKLSHTQQLQHDAAKIALKILETPPKYSMSGVIKQGFTPKILTSAEKKRLIQACVDHQLDDGPLMFAQKEYFCSQFALEATQIAALTQYIPNLQQYIAEEKKQIDPKNPKTRQQAIQRIMNKLNINEIWGTIPPNLIFSTPAKAISPTELFDLMKQSSSIICVSPSNIEQQSTCGPEEWKLEDTDLVLSPSQKPGCLESLAVKLLNQHVTSDTIQNSFIEKRFFTELSAATGYNPPTLQCLFDHLVKNQLSEIMWCAKYSIADLVKIPIFTPFITRSLSHAMDRLQQNPQLLNQLLSNDAAIQEQAACALFPYNEWTWDIPANIGILLSLKNNQPSFFFKYLPMALYWDPSILEKIKTIGLDQFYPILEKQTGIHKNLFKCLMNCSQNQDIASCMQTCWMKDLHFLYQLAINAERELQEIEKDPAAWLVKAIQDNSDFLSEYLELNPSANPVSLSDELWAKITQPNNEKYYKKILLPIGLIAYLRTTDPQQAMERLKNLCSYQNVQKIAQNEQFKTASKEVIFNFTIKKLTGLNYASAKCITQSCGFRINPENISCMLKCALTHASNSEKQIIKKLATHLNPEMNQESPQLQENIINILLQNSPSRTLMIKHLALAVDETSTSSKDLIELLQQEWKLLSSEEQIDALVKILHPPLGKYIKFMRLINEDGLKLIHEEYNILKKVQNNLIKLNLIPKISAHDKK